MRLARLLTLLLVCSLSSACDSEGEDTPPDLAGTWAGTATITSGGAPHTVRVGLDFTSTASVLTGGAVVSVDGSATTYDFEGVLQGSDLSLTLSGPEDDQLQFTARYQEEGDLLASTLRGIPDLPDVPITLRR